MPGFCFLEIFWTKILYVFLISCEEYNYEEIEFVFNIYCIMDVTFLIACVHLIPLRMAEFCRNMSGFLNILL
jgi:hypothetical protein